MYPRPAGNTHVNARGLACVLLVLLLAIPGVTAASTPSPGATPSSLATAPTNDTTNASPATHTEPPDRGTAYGVRTMYNTTRLANTSGGAGVNVAVLDTGVDRDHPDLANRIAECRDYTGDTVRHDTCTDHNGHGTHVAGIVLADGGPTGTGIYGLAPEAELFAFKVCTDRGSCQSSALRNALRDAVDTGAHIIVISLGGRANPHVQDAVEYAAQNDVLIVAAAGNSGPNPDSIEYPAADPRVIGVGALERTQPDGGITPTAYRVPDFSSRGANATTHARRDQYLDVAAPGTAIRSTWLNGEYATRSGTSMAAPHIAGLAAKLWPRAPTVTTDGKAADVRQLLLDRASAFDITSGRFAREGYDPAAGLGVPLINPPDARFVTEPGIPSAGTPTTLNATGSTSIDSPITAFSWDLTGDGTPDANGEITNYTFRTPGTHQITLRVRTRDGMTAATTEYVRINAPPTAVLTIAEPVPEQHRPVEFDASRSIDPDGEIVEYAWDMNDDTIPDARGPRLHYSFPTYGVHAVTLRVTDTDGATATARRSILVNDPPTVSIDRPSTILAEQRVTLAADIENEIGQTTVTWEFEDGPTATGPTVTRRFDPGAHTLTVRVEDEYGAATTTTLTVTVSEPRTTTAPSQPGFTIVITLLVFLLIAGLRRHRR